MAMGRPTKPTELKRRIGTLRPDRQKAAVTVLPAGTEPPRPPRRLKRLGRAAWKAYWALGEAWLSPRTDARVLERLCRAYDEEELLRRLLETEPRVVLTAKGLTSNPLIMQLRKLEEQITRYEGLCGFNPSDRSRLGLAEVQRVSKLEAFLQRRAGGED